MPINTQPLILASTASWRADILREMDLAFSVVAPPYEERHSQTLSPKEIAMLHAQGKAQAAATLRSDAYILAADQTAEFQGECLTKPKDLKACVKQLSLLQGQSHQLHSAVALYCPLNHRVLSKVVTVTLQMNHLSPVEVADYIHRDRPIGCVGSYKFELGGERLFSKVDNDQSAIVGLPKREVMDLLTEAAIVT